MRAGGFSVCTFNVEVKCLHLWRWVSVIQRTGFSTVIIHRFGPMFKSIWTVVSDTRFGFVRPKTSFTWFNPDLCWGINQWTVLVLRYSLVSNVWLLRIRTRRSERRFATSRPSCPGYDVVVRVNGVDPDLSRSSKDRTSVSPGLVRWSGLTQSPGVSVNSKTRDRIFTSLVTT